MAAKTELAVRLRTWAEKRLGVSSGRLQDLTSQTDIDNIERLLRVSGPPRQKLRIGGFYTADGNITTLLTTNQAMVVAPVLIEEFAIIEEIAVEVSTAGTEGSLYTVVYADRGDGYPGDLVHTSAALTVTPAAVKNTTGLTLPLPPGLYWIGVAVNGVVTTAPTVRALNHTSRFVGQTAASGSTEAGGYSQTGVTGTPPSTFSSTVTVAAAVPKVALKVKSG